MLRRHRSYFEPLNLAAYLAWAGIGSELWLGPTEGTGLLAEPWLTPLALALHGAYLLLFLLRQGWPEHETLRRFFTWAQWLATFALLAVTRFSSAPALLVIVLSQMAGLYGPRVLAPLFFASNVLLYAIVERLWGIQWPWVLVSIYASFELFAMMTAWYAISAQRSRDELAQTNAELLTTRSLLAESARDAERLRLARELHDVAGHKLTALKLNLAALARDPPRSDPAAIALCAQLADELLADIRGVVQQMRAHDGMDLRDALQKLAAPFPRPRAHLQIAGDARVASLAQAEAVLRAVQEALTNAARHGDAENLWIVLGRDGDRIRLDIRDDGHVAETWTPGDGLTGMRERLEAAGGGLAIARGDVGGLQLSAWLPVTP